MKKTDNNYKPVLKQKPIWVAARTRVLAMVLMGAISAITYSCSDLFSSCIEGNGELEIEDRAVASFNKVVHEGNFKVRIESDSAKQSLKVEGDENLLHLIETYVVDKTLHLRLQDNKCINSENEVVIYVTTASLESVEMSGSGELELSSFYEENIVLKLSGSGDIDVYNVVATNTINVELIGDGDFYLSGKASNATYLISGSGVIRADNLTAKDVRATITGSGNIHTYPLNHLYVNISGSGDVYYKGTPIISSTITGSGQVIKR